MKALGGSLKKGEKPCPVVFWKWLKPNEEGNEEASISDKTAPKGKPILRYYTVFNIEQCEGISEDKIPVREAFERNNTPIELCEQVVKERELIELQVDDLKSKQTILIQKNIDGLISDSILKSQLEMIENKIFNLYTSLSSNAEIKIDEKLITKVYQTYFSNPGYIWKNLSFKNKVKLQWFNFSKGIVFDGVNFRTTEIAFIYKLNDQILDSESTTVRDVGLEPTTFPV